MRNIKTVCERIHEFVEIPLENIKFLGEMDIWTISISKLIRDDLHIKAYDQSISHLLTTCLKQIRLNRFLQWHAVNGHPFYR